ncbi:hypothetical protein HYH03_018101 [Edaphochlamys debaryana]|uniref:Uncharacterized protein n=1 Tax=Edaphochlamys debaryana TaxID=47281 RepID=A0A835XIP2_9CHLO|nr:hypothetical protein HYH03_018101 [Edaphochlamys debaryana]|eukprot:KAG2483021.1 hypothetical protein HYH03_018101 [Edaphochlamys debaryana]
MTGGHGKHPQPPTTERNTAEGFPSRSNAGAEVETFMPRDEGVDVPPLVVPMTAEDERHMREDLGRDPKALLEKELANQEAREQRQEALRQAAPGDRVETMAAGERTSSPGRRPAATTPPDFANDKLRDVALKEPVEAHPIAEAPEAAGTGVGMGTGGVEGEAPVA